MYLKYFWRILILIFLIALILLGKLLFDLRKLDALDGKSMTEIYNVDSTDFYVTKRIWGIASGHELTIISPYEETSTALKDGCYNPNFEGLICFSSLTKTAIKEGRLVTYCNVIPNEQVNQKVYNGVTFVIQEPENNELADVKY